MTLLIPLERATVEECGGKAVGLSRLLRRGLLVPAGLCLPAGVYHDVLPGELPSEASGAAPVLQALRRWQPSDDLLCALQRAASQLGWPLVVRSSATCEDDLSAPGLFHTTSGVLQLEQLVQAIRRCWASLWEMPAWIVLRRHGRSPAREAMAVLLQHQMSARLSGLALSRDHRDALRVEVVDGGGEALASGEADPVSLQLPREGEIPFAGAEPLSQEEAQALRSAVLEAELEWGAPVEVEWVLDRQIWLVQARASVAPPLAVEAQTWPMPGGSQRRWRWDREHNPEPLSPIHASLIQELDPERAQVAVVHGYLFEAVAGTDGSGGGDELESQWDGFLRRQVPELESLERRLQLQVEQALTFFVGFHRAYFGELSRTRRRARADLVQYLRRHHASRADATAARLTETTEHSTLERTFDLQRLAALAGQDPELRRFVGRDDVALNDCPSAGFCSELERHLARYGTLAPVWDVAVATLAEDPGLLLRRLRGLVGAPRDLAAAWARQQSRARASEQEIRRRLDPADQDRLETLLVRARLARRIEEEDDLLFSRALWVLRRALLEVARDWIARGALQRPDDLFLLELSEVRAALRETQPPPGRLELAERRLRWEQQRRLLPPLAPRQAGEALRGLGVGGSARGEVRLVVHLEQLLRRDLGGAVVVCPTLLPALAIVLPEVAALVTDHGGLLSHAASMARELGVVAVVGTGCATRVLREGEEVWVDGDRGLVLPIR